MIPCCFNSDLSSYEYYILGAMALIGILLMIVAVKKPKKKMLPQMQIMTKNQVNPQRQIMRSAPQQQMAPRPVQRQQQVSQRPIQRQSQPLQQVRRAPQNIQRALPSLKPAIRPQMQSKQPVQATQRPAQRQQIPARRLVPAAKPVQVQQRSMIRPQQVPQRQVNPIQRYEQAIQTPVFTQPQPRQVEKKSFFSRFQSKNNGTNKGGIKPIGKKEQQMINNIEQSLNKQVYDIDALKAKERRV